MKDLNAKAPENRKQEVSPLVGSIIKISALIVIAGLVVLITLITINLINKNKDNDLVDPFANRVVITLADYQIITTGGDFADLSEHVRPIVNNLVKDNVHETTDFYFFFFYQANLEQLNQDIIDLVNSEDYNENLPIFVAKLDGTGEETSALYNYLVSQEHDGLYPEDSEIVNSLNSKYNNSILIVFNFLAEEQFGIYSRVSEQKSKLESLTNN